VETLKKMTLLGGTCRRWQDNIKMDREDLEQRSVNYSKWERKEMLRGF